MSRGVFLGRDMHHLSFREELHSIEAVIRGQGIGIFSNVFMAQELTADTPVQTFDLSLPRYSVYVVRRPGHPREKVIQAFSAMGVTTPGRIQCLSCHDNKA